MKTAYRILLGLSVWTSSVFAAEKPTIYFDFENMRIYSRGVYKPEADAKHKIDPLKAESAARANGIANIKNYFNEKCLGSKSKVLEVSSGFDKFFRSQGTEIYSNGALEVNLMASYQDIVKSIKPQKIQTEEGKTIVFALPNSMPSDAAACGVPAFEFKNSFDQSIRINLVPASTQKDLKNKEKLVKLVFDAQKKALVLNDPSDISEFKKIQIKFSDSGESYVPVTVYLKK